MSHKKVVPFRKRTSLNIGIIIFIIMFLYVCFSVYTYVSRKNVHYYEVASGDIVNNKSYTGFIIRSENLQYAEKSGYINYYIRDGKRAAVGTRIYSLDETGELSKYLSDNAMENFSLSNENIAEIKSKLTAMTIDYTDDNFEVVYDTKSSIDSAMIEYTNLNAMDNLDTLMTEKGIVYTQATCPYSGIVSLTTDDYSDITYDAITEEDLDKSKYIASTIQSGSLVEAGSAVYKIVDSENWSIVFKLDDDDIERFSNKNSLSIDISGSNLTASGSYMQFTGKDNNTYGMISLSRYMVDFISQRYLTFSINDGSESGLKIPQKAITEKSFFIVPISYLARGGDNIDEGFYKEIYNEQGTSIQYVPTTIFYSDEEYYYIDNTDKSEFKAGDYIIQPNTNERYQIGQIASLEGVYNINKGYAVFKQIDIISSNDEYCIVKRNTKYGLSVYDHILIDTTGISEGDFIYE